MDGNAEYNSDCKLKNKKVTKENEKILQKMNLKKQLYKKRII